MEMNTGAFKPLARLGPIESIELVETKKKADATHYSYRVTFKGIALSADFSLSDGGKIITFALTD